MQKVIATIDLENIRRNAQAFIKRSGTKLCAVVKADAYGHGAEEVTNALSDIADGFAVALIEEGMAIRASACGKDILVFTPPMAREEAYALAVNGFIATIPDLYTARLFIATCEEYRLQGRVHLKVNTGMNRYGMNGSMLGKVCKLFKGSSHIQVEGIYSHLYECNLKTAAFQREKFLQMQRIAKRYFPALISHLGATYGALLGEAYAFDMVRVGLGLYGYAPVKTELPLYPAMRLSTRVVCNRKYAYGGVCYGSAKGVEKGEKIAIVRAGYADGLLRRRENGADGWSQGINALCMDVCARKSNARRGAIIPLVTDAEGTAREAETIPYEVLCAATRRAARIYL